MIIFDTETTGLPLPLSAPLSKQPSIIEFAAAELDDKTLKEKRVMEFLCHPGFDISAEITKITGINNSDLKGKQPFGPHIAEVAEFFLGQRISCGHNLEFDCSLLSFELMRAGLHFRFPWPTRRICTVESSMSIRGHRFRLIELYEMATGTKHTGAHRALNDVRATAACLRWLKGKGLVTL